MFSLCVKMLAAGLFSAKKNLRCCKFC